MMELNLSLGEPQKPLKFFANSSTEMVHKDPPGLGFCMALTPSSSDEEITIACKRDDSYNNNDQRNGSSQHPPLLQLHLHPFSPLHERYPFPLNPHCLTSERRNRSALTRKLAEEDVATGSSSPNNSSMLSSFGMELEIYKDGSGKREHEEVGIKKESYSYRGESDEEDNGVMCRKKLRLTKDQSAFLEESFKDHHTLNPKQKLALAKHLNLRPRQVEVWFQNRRARTKLKQTEVDCDYLKRCCETLTEENRRLQKELQELRTLKSSNSFYMQLPATTLTMCPSCEHVTSTTTSTASAMSPPATKPRLLPFLQDQCHSQLQAS